MGEIMSETIDLAIIGAGPAGLTAGLYGARGGLGVVVFEAVAAGGQLAQTDRVDNYPGFPEGAEGFQLAWDMRTQAERFGATILTENVESVDFSSDPKRIVTSGGTYEARQVIVASGAHPRKLGLDLEDKLRGRGVSYCATCDGGFFRGKDVVVVGGGDTAAADALYLSRLCRKVYLVHRRDKLRATQIYHARLAETENVEFVWNSEARELVANENGAVSSLVVRNKQTGEDRTLEASGVFVAVGTVPNTAFLGGQLNLDPAGYIVADESGKTNVPGVYAAGDVRTKTLRQVVTAVSDGAECAQIACEQASI